MKHSFYKDLQRAFIDIRFCYSGADFDREWHDKTITQLRASRKKIHAQTRGQEKEVLLYCIDTLFAILNEGDRQKVWDFADAVHNVPEIYMQTRNLYSFRLEFRTFQRKYGKQYFPFIHKIKPQFLRKAPKNKWEFFSAASDTDFKMLHPVGYNVLLAIGLVALLLPQIVYIAYVLFIRPAPEEWTIMLGYVGTFLIGIGLFNIVGAWIHQYLGHLLTVICLVDGAAMTWIALVLLYT